jgi:hypothetical protein
MNEFTLFNALNIVKRHLLVTIAIFFAAYWVLPNLNILENQYSAQKIIKPGSHHNGFFVPLLNYPDINGILLSTSFRNYLSEDTNGSGVASYKISENEVGNMLITFKSNDKVSIINTAGSLMKKLQEFDRNSIQVQIQVINEILDVDREILRLLLESNNDYFLTDKDIEEWATKQKEYDLAIQDTNEFNQKYKINLVNIMKYKSDDTSRQIKLKKEILNLQKKIEDFELILKDGFKPVSYYFPVSKNDISIYFPNPIIFFGLSLLMAFLYNLILLVYKYRKGT